MGNLELLFDILHRGQRADSGDRGSGAHCPVEHDSEDQRVRAVQRHYIMRLHTPVREGSGECIHHCFELAIRGLRAGGAIDDGDALGVFRLKALENELVKGTGGDVDVWTSVGDGHGLGLRVL